MQIQVNDHATYCYTGGKPFTPLLPTAVFIHGVLNDHSVWILQSRFLAHHGWNVLAVDLPGHCRSAGEAPESVEEAAGFIASLLDAAGIAKAALIGHSWGALIALEAASQLGERISHLVLVGIAYPMRVSPALLDAALHTPMKALAMVNTFSRSTLAPPPSVLGPGTWVHGASMALGRRVLVSNRAVNVFHRGFLACDRYAAGKQAIAKVSCPVLFILGALDQMTQPKAAAGLIEIAQSRPGPAATEVTRLPVGHHQMSEAPDATLLAIRDFLAQAI